MATTQFDLMDLANENEYFRKVLFTGMHSQLVIMALRPGEEIGEEVHEVDQFIYLVEGEGQTVIAGTTAPFAKGEAVCIPAGMLHNVRNTADSPMKLFTVYSPPEHPAGLVEKVKADVRDESPAVATG